MCFCCTWEILLSIHPSLCNDCQLISMIYRLVKFYIRYCIPGNISLYLLNIDVISQMINILFNAYVNHINLFKTC